MLLQMRHHHLLDVGQPLFLCAAQVGLSEEAKDLSLPVLMLLLLQTHRACRRATFEPHQSVQLLHLRLDSILVLEVSDLLLALSLAALVERLEAGRVIDGSVSFLPYRRITQLHVLWNILFMNLALFVFIIAPFV